MAKLLQTLGRPREAEAAYPRALSLLEELAQREGITRRYIRRLVNLAFLSPDLVETFLDGRQPVGLTATRLTELDLDSLVAVVAPHNTLPPRLGTKLAWLSTAPSPSEIKSSGDGQSCCRLISLDHSARTCQATLP